MAFWSLVAFGSFASFLGFWDFVSLVVLDSIAWFLLPGILSINLRSDFLSG